MLKYRSANHVSVVSEDVYLSLVWVCEGHCLNALTGEITS